MVGRSGAEGPKDRTPGALPRPNARIAYPNWAGKVVSLGTSGDIRHLFELAPF
jgi:hypothetical protein